MIILTFRYVQCKKALENVPTMFMMQKIKKYPTPKLQLTSKAAH